MGQWVMGANDPCDPSRSVDPFSLWPMTHWPIICSYSAIACFGKRIIRGVHTNTSNFSQKLGERINKHINPLKICTIFVPMFSQDTPVEWTPLRVRWFSFFRKSSQPETNQICHPFTWLHAWWIYGNLYKLCQPAWRQTWSGRSLYKAWLAEDSVTGCRTPWCREELQSNVAHVCFVWKWKKLKNFFKCPLVNETLWPETETFGFQSETRPRPRPSHTLPRPRRDRDVWKIRLETVSRPRRRDRDYYSGHWLVISSNRCLKFMNVLISFTL